ncbi:MAG: hypothetical protein ABIJ46_03860 [bacterium]
MEINPTWALAALLLSLAIFVWVLRPTRPIWEGLESKYFPLALFGSAVCCAAAAVVFVMNRHSVESAHFLAFGVATGILSVAFIVAAVMYWLKPGGRRS